MVLKARLGESVKRSPMLPMEEHMLLVTRTAEELERFLAAVQERDWETAETLQKSIATLEDAADKLKRQIRHTLPKRLWMPVARADLLDLVSVQDKIANVSKDIAGLMLGRRLAFPGKLDKSVNTYVQQSVETVRAALAAVKATNDLIRSGFGEHKAREVEKLILEVELLERRSDKLQMKLRSRLHKLESKLEPVDVMFLYQVLVWLGRVADRAENVGHRLTLIINA